MKHCLGSEGGTILKHTPKVLVLFIEGEGDGAEDEYATAIKSLDTRFKACKNVTLERHKFYKRAQQPGESASTYVGALRILAASCNYNTFEEEMFRDQLVEKTNSKKVQETLLSKPDLTLQKAFEIATRIESTTSYLEQISISQPTVTVTSVAAVKSKNKRFQEHSQQMRSGGGFPNSNTSSNTRRRWECYRCGSNSHLGNAKFCPALNKTCSKCFKRGHFASVCKSSNKSSGPSPAVPSLSKKVLNLDHASGDSASSEEDQICLLSVSTDIISTISHETRHPICMLSINGKDIKMLADSGSPFTLISDKIWESSFSSQGSLSQTAICPIAYGGKSIDVLGEFQAELCFKDSSAQSIVYVAKDDTCLLGWHDQGKLGIVLDPNDPLQVILRKDLTRVLSIRETKWKSNFPDVFNDKLGLIKGFKHKIVLKDGAQPIIHKVRKVPLALKEALKLELEKLCTNDIIEPIESLDWVSPIVLARKANGNIRMCVDLRELNRHIWVDQHPLPNITEMVSTLKNGRHFSLLDITSAYHQVDLHPDSRHFTAFITPEGLYQFKRMPFGLSSASAVFQRIVDGMFKRIPGVMAFQDDVLVYGQNQKQHDNTLQTVLSILKDRGVTKS